MVGRRTGTGLVVLLLLLSLGCSSRPACPVWQRSPDRHLVFNPDWNPIRHSTNERPDWPRAARRTTGAESVFYVIKHTDMQGDHYRGDDYLRRRFTEVRVHEPRR